MGRDPCARHGRWCIPMFLHGTIYDEILRCGRQARGPDVIVMGSHRPRQGFTCWDRIAARVMRHARCSVDVVRGPERWRDMSLDAALKGHLPRGVDGRWLLYSRWRPASGYLDGSGGAAVSVLAIRPRCAGGVHAPGSTGWPLCPYGLFYHRTREVAGRHAVRSPQPPRGFERESTWCPGGSEGGRAEIKLAGVSTS